MSPICESPRQSERSARAPDGRLEGALKWIQAITLDAEAPLSPSDQLDHLWMICGETEK